MHPTRIKICGLTREADVDAAAEAGADAIGFVLYPKSRRAVSVPRAAELARRLPAFVMPVLLFVNADSDVIQDALQQIPTALLQFHGDESPDRCESWGRPFLKALAVSEGVDLLDCQVRFHAAQALLLDAPVEGYGGGGKVFDWSLIPSGVRHRLVLSGGLNPANVIDGVTRVRPWAVDVSSGVEVAKGVKDPDKMRAFCQAVRQADLLIEAGTKGLA